MTTRQRVFGNHQGSLEWLATLPGDVVAYARKTLVTLMPNLVTSLWLTRKHTYTRASTKLPSEVTPLLTLSRSSPFIYLFNSLFTVDFSIVIVTNLHRLTENFIIKGKFKNILKVATRGAFRIQSKPEMKIFWKTVNRYKR